MQSPSDRSAGGGFETLERIARVGAVGACGGECRVSLGQSDRDHNDPGSGRTQRDRVGCFQYQNVAGARSNTLADHVTEEVKQERWARFMEKAQAISEAKLAAILGTRLQALVDEVDAEAATRRPTADAPEIDGNLLIDEGFEGLEPGDLLTAEVDEASE